MQSDDQIISLVNDSINISGEFLDVNEEKKRKDLQIVCAAYVLFRMIMTDSGLNVSQLSSEIQREFAEKVDVPDDVIESMFTELTQETFIDENDGVIHLDFSEIQNTVSFLSRVFTFGIRPEMLDCKNYLDLIDDKLVTAIEDIQGGLPIPKDDKLKLQQLLSISPSAMVIAIHPISLIVNSRSQHENLPKIMDKAQLEILYAELFEGLRRDYEIADLIDYYFNKGLIEFEILTEYKIKTKDSIWLEHESKSRFAVGTMSIDDGTTRFVRVLKTNNQPEPWDQANQ